MTWLEVFRGLGSRSLAHRTGSLSRKFCFYDGSIVNISDRDWYGKFEGGRFSLIARVFWISFVDASHFLDRSEDIFAISLVFLAILLVTKCVVGFLEKLQLFVFFFLIFKSLNLSKFVFVGLLNFLGRSRYFKSLIVQWIPK
jgi:hypothetical protein